MVPLIECSTYPIFGKAIQLQIEKRRVKKGTKKISLFSSSPSTLTGSSTLRNIARIDSSDKIDFFAATESSKFLNFSRASSSRISSTPRDFKVHLDHFVHWLGL